MAVADAAGCVLLAGCTATVAGQGTADQGIKHLNFNGMPLGKLDACSLLADDFVTKQFGASLPKTTMSSKHYCEWGGSVHDAGDVNLSFAAYKPSAGRPGTTQENLGGRTSTVIPLDATLCGIETSLGEDWGPGESGSKQMAAIDVTTTDGKDPCAVARTVATAAWPKLPAVS
ncbi:hypothetical protein [Amycolatopsis sp.]|uniref:hypothetical protein n=1 Tax=Amycolatopsis sp. TaxID=37632 RepID=UPI0026222BF4|nr:hypothetical protein [Amycolatopsis sp.]